jgi:broad specificity phosphatase PhoE
MMNSNEFRAWVEQYDASPIVTRKVLIEQAIWNKCYCSDWPRAIATAHDIYAGDIIKSELLREVPIAPVIKTQAKLPYLFWCIAGRMAWLASGQSQPEVFDQTKNRVRQFLAEILAEENVLIVTHGFLMMHIQQELFCKGFAGKRIIRAKPGEMYVFENANSP